MLRNKLEYLKPHILIRTYNGDKEWLSYCLRSIQNHNPEIGITVVAPVGHDVGCECKYVHPVHQDGYVDQQHTKLRAVAYVPEDTTHVIHLDSDCLLVGNLMDLFVNNKPILLKTPWSMLDKDASIWRGITQHYMGFDPEYEYMRRHPLVYPLKIYNEVNIYLSNIHGTWENVFANIDGRNFSEFNILGAYADRFMSEEFHWIDTSKDPLPTPIVKQGWSWGGIDAVRKEWEDTLSANLK